ncbi:MAG: hypothetical protein ACT4NP_14620 [Pseudonocardiales bacterium]
MSIPARRLRKLPSGRFQASYLGPDGQRRLAPETFERKSDADRWLSVVESEILRGEWTDPLLGRVPFAEFGERWIKEHRLGERTRQEYLGLWRNHVGPLLGSIELAEFSTGTIRSWRATLLLEGRSEDRVAKAYRLVRAIFNTAVDDGRIKRNSCRIKGAGEHAVLSGRPRLFPRFTHSPSGCLTGSGCSCSRRHSPVCGGVS